MDPVVVFLAGGALAALGGVFVFSGVRNMRRASQSMKWPSVPGTITSSQLVTGGTIRSRWYKAHVTYTFSVNGQTYTGDKVVFGDARSGNQPQEQAVVSRYTAGAPVEVFYDPLQPQQAVLQRKTRGSISYLIAGVFLIFMGIVFIPAMWLIGLAQK